MTLTRVRTTHTPSQPTRNTTANPPLGVEVGVGPVDRVERDENRRRLGRQISHRVVEVDRRGRDGGRRDLHRKAAGLTEVNDVWRRWGCRGVGLKKSILLFKFSFVPSNPLPWGRCSRQPGRRR